ncbi:hypothetical protein N7488_006073 [Penicillium malachiteum]|nr:hypothetical protein N7488_006073 [Penicillium malachiteum]
MKTQTHSHIDLNARVNVLRTPSKVRSEANQLRHSPDTEFYEAIDETSHLQAPHNFRSRPSGASGA